MYYKPLSSPEKEMRPKNQAAAKLRQVQLYWNYFGGYEK